MIGGLMNQFAAMKAAQEAAAEQQRICRSFAQKAEDQHFYPNVIDLVPQADGSFAIPESLQFNR